ncbi:hypothetical protein, partial [Pseudomonas sp. IT-P294]|uniref:hypothetical protein n=1 Tax=Pseudomonas sp. IT-P294 TaxID=3026454 RepID=UPI0039E1256C
IPKPLFANADRGFVFLASIKTLTPPTLSTLRNSASQHLVAPELSSTPSNASGYACGALARRSAGILVICFIQLSIPGSVPKD